MSDDDVNGTTTRRGILAGIGATVLYALGFFTGTASADDGSESGQIGSAANPALKVYNDTYHYHERSSHPSSPDDGTEYYNPSP